MAWSLALTQPSAAPPHFVPSQFVEEPRREPSGRMRHQQRQIQDVLMVRFIAKIYVVVAINGGEGLPWVGQTWGLIPLEGK